MSHDFPTLREVLAMHEGLIEAFGGSTGLAFPIDYVRHAPRMRPSRGPLEDVNIPKARHPRAPTEQGNT